MRQHARLLLSHINTLLVHILLVNKKLVVTFQAIKNW